MAAKVHDTSYIFLWRSSIADEELCKGNLQTPNLCIAAKAICYDVELLH